MDIVTLGAALKGANSAVSAVANRGAKNVLPKPESITSQFPTLASAVVNADDSITVTVTETLSRAVIVYYDVELPDGTFIFSCGADSGTGEEDSYDCFIWDTAAKTSIIRDNDDSEPFSKATISAGTYQLRIRMRIGAEAGTYIFKPMLRDARIADDEYIPPAMSNAELTAIIGNKNYIEVNGVRLYISSTEPTGDIPDGSVGVGW